jgi:AraC-like DNA-binding protein
MQCVFGFAAKAGVRADELLHAAQLGPALLAGADVELLHSQELRLWAEASRLTGDADFGLHLAEWVIATPAEHLDVLAFAARSCATLGDNFQCVGRYLRLVHDGIYLTLEEEQDVARLVHGHHREPPEPPRHPVEGQLAIALLQGRRAIGVEFVPRAVRFRHDRPAREREHARIFRAPVSYGCPRNELVLDRALLARPQRKADRRLLAMLDRQLDRQLATRPDGQGTRGEVRRRMLEELPGREPTVGAIASELHMSPRSLQRRLGDEGTTFAELLAELRHELALRHLQDQRLSIGEVAFLLGFVDVSSFHRAFKRWTGHTPAEYRRAAPRAASDVTNA